MPIPMKPPRYSEMIASPDSGMISPQAFPGQIDTVCAVNEAIEDCDGVYWIADDLMPGRHRKLTCDNGRAPSVEVVPPGETVLRLG